MGDLALYGVMRNHPRWLVYLRGLWWLRSGFCPCCYSSPPRDDCPICHGNRQYGPYDLTHDQRWRWGHEWRARFTADTAARDDDGEARHA